MQKVICQVGALRQIGVANVSIVAFGVVGSDGMFREQ